MHHVPASHAVRKSILILTVLILLCAAIPASAYEIDTSMVRDKPVQKTTAVDIIMAVPTFIITLPFHILEGFSSFVLNEIVFSEFIQQLIFMDVERFWGLYPVIGYGSNPGFKFGFTFTSEDAFAEGERIQAKAYISTHKYQTYRLIYDAPSDLGLIKDLSLMAEYKKQTHETFFGLGNTSRDNDEVSFSIERTVFGIEWFPRLYDKFRFGLSGGYSIYNIYDGQDDDHVTGLDSIQELFALSQTEISASRLWNVGISLHYNWVDHPGRPSSGGYEKISLTYNKGIDRSDDLEYWYGKIDLAQYFNLYKKRVLAFRLLAEAVNRPGDSPDIPFYLRPSLGGWESLRGFNDHRFVDHSLTLASLEYRYPVMQHIDGFIFYEQGRVFDAISEDFTLRGWNYSVGGGLRLWKLDEIMFRGTLAYGKDGFQVYAEFEESF